MVESSCHFTKQGKAYYMAIISECIVNENKTLTVPKITWKPKKLTGARFAAVLGEDPFLTPFGVWCELTRVAQKPFEENKYTIAGNFLEDDIAAYTQSKSKFFLSQPHMIWGYSYKSETNYDFYPENEIFGGMWDAQLLDNGNLIGIFEFKTSSRRDVWEKGIPKAYERQAQLYAYLSGTPYYHFAVSFLTEEELDEPATHKCTDDNTMLLHKRLPKEFQDTIEKATQWYGTFIRDGATSPAYDEEKDKEYLDILRGRGYQL